MWDFSIGRALSLLMQTMPFILLRLCVYFGITLAYILGTGTGAGVGYGIGGLGEEGFAAGSTFWGGFIGFSFVGFLVYWFREYLLYMVKAGHIAVLVEKMDNQPLPEGKSQIAHAQSVVQERFVEASVLFGVDQLIKGVLRAIMGLIRTVFTIIPIPGVRNLVSIIHAILKTAVGYIDEVILAYAIRTRSNNPWESAKTALVLYGQNYRAMLKNAVWLTIFVYLLSFVIFLVMLAPAAGIAAVFPGSWSAIGVIIAILMAWSVKVAVVEPFAVTCMMQVFFKEIEGQSPDPAWEARLNDMSDKFRNLGDRAAQWVDRKAGGGAGDRAEAPAGAPVDANDAKAGS
jgi:hypothetical protein